MAVVVGVIVGDNHVTRGSNNIKSMTTVICSDAIDNESIVYFINSETVPVIVMSLGSNKSTQHSRKVMLREKIMV
jgi:hypothetical protein